MTPLEIIAELDRYVVGQTNAKRALALAVRNRWRFRQINWKDNTIPPPKNILLIGPTGVGKTELSRHLAKVTGSPLLTVNITDFTETGYQGRDVSSIIKDLVKYNENLPQDRVPKLSPPAEEETKLRQRFEEELLKQMAVALLEREKVPKKTAKLKKERFDEIKAAVHDDKLMHFPYYKEEKLSEIKNVHVMMKVKNWPTVIDNWMEHKDRAVNDLFNKRNVNSHEMKNKVQKEKLHREWIENEAIIFIDEIDKINQKESDRSSPGREGVQRELLTMVEGRIVNTEIGPIDTTNILFIGSGAFHTSKPTDLMPELLGRFPIWAYLQPLEVSDLEQILTQTSALEMYQELLKVDGVDMEIQPEAVKRLANIANDLNAKVNMGARRLHGLTETLMQDYMLEPPRKGKLVITSKLVDEKLKAVVAGADNRDNKDKDDL